MDSTHSFTLVKMQTSETSEFTFDTALNGIVKLQYIHYGTFSFYLISYQDVGIDGIASIYRSTLMATEQKGWVGLLRGH